MRDCRKAPSVYLGKDYWGYLKSCVKQRDTHAQVSEHSLKISCCMFLFFYSLEQ